MALSLTHLEVVAAAAGKLMVMLIQKQLKKPMTRMTRVSMISYHQQQDCPNSSPRHCQQHLYFHDCCCCHGCYCLIVVDHHLKKELIVVVRLTPILVSFPGHPSILRLLISSSSWPRIGMVPIVTVMIVDNHGYKPVVHDHHLACLCSI